MIITKKMNFPHAQGGSLNNINLISSPKIVKLSHDRPINSNGFGIELGKCASDTRVAIFLADMSGYWFSNDYEITDLKKFEFTFKNGDVKTIHLTSLSGTIYEDDDKKGAILGATDGGNLAVLLEYETFLTEIGIKNDKIMEIYDTGKYSDYTIIYKDKKYPVHKYVLVTNSEYFAIKFDGKWNENKDELPIVDDGILEIVLEFMYFKIFNPQPLDKLLQIKILADFLQIDGLIKIINRHISKEPINKDNYKIFFNNDDICVNNENEIIKLVKEDNKAYDYLSQNNPGLKEKITRYMLEKN